MTYTVRIDADRLRAIALFAGKEDVRYYLNGVCIEFLADGTPILAATNGHLLGAMPAHATVQTHNALIGAPTRIISAEKIKLALAALPKGGTTIVVEIDPADANAVTLAVPGPSKDTVAMRIDGCGIDGKFPEWRRCVPAYDTSPIPTGDDLCFNGEYVAVFAKAAKTLNSGKRAGSTGLAFQRGSRDSSIAVGIFDQPSFVGVLMPMRGELGTANRPAWLKSPPKAA